MSNELKCVLKANCFLLLFSANYLNIYHSEYILNINVIISYLFTLRLFRYI